MTKTQLNAFRRVLENNWDRIQNAGDRDYAMRNLKRNSNRLHEVRAALGRMDTGTFGICLGCQENINPRRLAAVPWASYCIACQEAADRERNPLRSEVDTLLVTAA